MVSIGTRLISVSSLPGLVRNAERQPRTSCGATVCRPILDCPEDLPNASIRLWGILMTIDIGKPVNGEKHGS